MREQLILCCDFEQTPKILFHGKYHSEYLTGGHCGNKIIMSPCYDKFMRRGDFLAVSDYLAPLISLCMIFCQL